MSDTNDEDLPVGSTESLNENKIGSNRLLEKETPPTRNEEAKKAAREEGENFMQGVKEEEGKLGSLLSHGCRLVGNVEIASMSAEITAVTNDEVHETKWRTLLDEDAARTKVSLDKIEKGWEDTQQMGIAEDFQMSLQDLKEESDALLKKKRELVTSLKQQLTTIDDSFSTERIKQSRQRSQMLSRITEHVLELVKAYQSSISTLQDSSDITHKNLLKHFSGEINQSFGELNTNLHNLLTQRKQKRIARTEELMRLQVYGTDHQMANQTSRSDVEKVLLELYRMTARRKVEEEQLEFNSEVLREQCNETTALVSEGRRRVNAWRPLVREYRRKWDSLEVSRSKSSRLKLTEFVTQKEQLRLMKERLSQLMTQSRMTLRGLSYMHYNQLHDHVMKVHELDRSIERLVLSRDFSADLDTQLLKDLHPALQPKDTPALAAAARILDTKKAMTAQDFEIGDGCSEDVALEDVFLQQVARAAGFLVESLQEEPPGGGEDPSGASPSASPLLVLEQIFWELGIKTERDVTKVLDISKKRFYSTRKKRPSSENSIPTVDLQSSQDSCDAATNFFSVEDVLLSLIEFSKQRGKLEHTDKLRELESASETPRQEHLPMPSNEDVRRWSQLVGETTRERKKSWKLIRDALREYHSILTSRLVESERVENLREENREFNYLLVGMSSEIGVSN